MSTRCDSHDQFLQQCRIQELLLRRPLPLQPSYPEDLLGMPGNSLARDCVSGRFPEWDLEYRVARDGIAYNRLEFKAHYGCEQFRRYWEEATFATPLDKHQALLSALRLKCDCMRMTKVAEALWKAHVFDDRILDLICSFGVGHTISSVYYITSSGVKNRQEHNACVFNQEDAKQILL